MARRKLEQPLEWYYNTTTGNIELRMRLFEPAAGELESEYRPTKEALVELHPVTITERDIPPE